MLNPFFGVGKEIFDVEMLHLQFVTKQPSILPNTLISIPKPPSLIAGYATILHVLYYATL